MNFALLAATVNLKMIEKEPKSMKNMKIQTILALNCLSCGENSLFSQMMSLGSDAC